MVVYSVGNIDQSRMSREQKAIFGQPLDIFFPIGELSVAASRESLSNDEKTITNILKALDEISKGLLEEVKKKLDEASTGWQARLMINSMSVGGGHFSGLVNEYYNSGLLYGQYSEFTFGEFKNKIVRTPNTNITILRSYYQGDVCI